MGLFSKAMKAIGNQISDSFDNTAVGKFVKDVKSDDGKVIKYDGELPPISDEIQTITLLGGKKFTYNTADSTSFWNSDSNCGMKDISTVFYYSCGGIPVESDDVCCNNAKIYFEYALNEFDSDSETEKLKVWFDFSQMTYESFDENDFITATYIGESKDRYIEVNYFNYDIEIDGVVKTVYYKVTLDIDSTTLNPYGIAMVSHDYHTILSTMQSAD